MLDKKRDEDLLLYGDELVKFLMLEWNVWLGFLGP